jgi:hypothetical protein
VVLQKNRNIAVDDELCYTVKDEIVVFIIRESREAISNWYFGSARYQNSKMDWIQSSSIGQKLKDVFDIAFSVALVQRIDHNDER